MASKTLPTLIRISKFELDEKQRALADLLRAQDEIIRQQQALEAQKEREEQTVREHQELGGEYYQGYLNYYFDKRENLAKAMEDIKLIIEQAREILREAYQQHKTYEITQENIEKKEREELEQKDQKNADEMALNLFRRK